MSAILSDNVLPFLIIGVVLLILFLIYGVPFLIRTYVKSTGELADATIIDFRSGRGAVYSGSEYNHQLVAQKIILKLEVHPKNGAPYVTEDRFMAKAMDLMKLRPGCNIQVRVAAGNPKRVVCLPETVTASASAPVEARASVAIANLVANAKNNGSGMSPEDVMKAFQAQGIRSRPMTTPDDPKAKLEQLKEMLNSGLITQQEFEAKKAEILSKM